MTVTTGRRTTTTATAECEGEATREEKQVKNDGGSRWGWSVVRVVCGGGGPWLGWFTVGVVLGGSGW